MQNKKANRVELLLEHTIQEIHSSPVLNKILVESWSEEEKLAVWEKGNKAKRKHNGELLDPAVWRIDSTGKLIKYSEYGNVDSIHGREIDHIHPVSNGGSDHLKNLQPLQWLANRKKGKFI